MRTREHDLVRMEEDSPGEPDTVWTPVPDQEGADSEGEPDEVWPSEPDDE